jgi:hypothetical protein
MNNLNRASQIFKKLLTFNGSVLFSMSIQRLVLFLVVVRHWLFGADGFSIASSFFAGVRFDLCVLGFINIPVLFITWLISTDKVAESPHKVMQFFRDWILWIYLGVSTLAIHVLGLLDMMFFARQGHRWTYFDWQENGLGFFSEVSAKWGPTFTAGVVLLFILLWGFRSVFVLYKLQLHKVKISESKYANSKPLMIISAVILPLLAVAFSARGTWTPHHIGMEHAEVSQNQALNQLALSPVWAFDKKF